MNISRLFLPLLPLTRITPLLILTFSLCSSVVAEDAPETGVEDIRILLKTDNGDVEATIFASKVPTTAANFLNLARRDYYDNLTFHRVISKANGDRENFMIQGGDPSGTGQGGPGYTIDDELRADLKHSKPGIFSMAKTRLPNTGGSQFFITLAATQHLNGLHSVFGEVTKGQEVVDTMKRGGIILDIEILDPLDALFTLEKENLAEWNDLLDRRYPKSE